ncbi:MAG: topoisomerase C-terminal repeat-containing protein, partial [Pseudomonadota bacterium]
EVVEAGLYRYGPAVRHGKIYAPLEDWTEALTVGMNRAVELIALKKANPGRGRGSPQKPLRELGEHPEGGPIVVMEGRYGPYLKWEKINATLPKAVDPQAVTPEQAVEILAEKAAKAPKKKAAKKPAKKAATKKTAAKKKPAAKKTAKKSAEPEPSDDPLIER